MADSSAGLLAAIDVGSSKTVCAIAESISPTRFKVIGLGVVKSAGVRNGIADGIEPLVNTIGAAVSGAEKTAGVSIKDVAVGISGTQIISQNMYMMTQSQGEVSKKDIDDLQSKLEGSAILDNQRYLAMLPISFTLDGTPGIRHPIGMAAHIVEGHFHVVKAKPNPCQNLNRAITRAGFKLYNNELLFNPLSSAMALLTPEEKRNGVALIDIGAHLIDIAVFIDEAVQYSAVVEGGGQQITNHISLKAEIDAEKAEDLKIRMGQVKFNPMHDEDASEALPVYPGFSQRDSRTITKQALSSIIDEKVAELLEKVYYRIQDQGFHSQLQHGVVLTGGTARLRGIDRMAREVFSSHMAGRDMNVRIGRPIIVNETKEFIAPEQYSSTRLTGALAGFSLPEFSTVMGHLYEQNVKMTSPGSRVKKSWTSTIKDWIFGNF